LNTEPLVDKNEPHTIVNTLVGILTGALIALLYIFLKEYFTPRHG